MCRVRSPVSNGSRNCCCSGVWVTTVALFRELQPLLLTWFYLLERFMGRSRVSEHGFRS